MTLTKLSNNRLIENLRWILKNHKIIWIFSIIPFLVFVLTEVLVIMNYADFNVISSNSISDISIATGTSIVVASGVSFVLSFILISVLFSYLFSKRKLDFYHALPISRNTMLVSRFIATLISIVIPEILIMLSMILAKLFGIEEKLNININIETIISNVSISFFAGLAVVAIFIFCAVASATMTNYILFSIGTSILFFGGIEATLNYIPKIVAGLDLSNLTYYISPINVFSNIIIGKTSFVISCLSMIVIFIVAIALSFVVYNKKDSEDAQIKPSSNIPVIFTILGLQLSIFSFAVTKLNVAICIIALTLTSLLGYFILTKNKNMKFPAIQSLVVSIICVAIYIIGSNGLFSYEQNIPKINEIASVNFTTSDNNNNEFGVLGKMVNKIMFESPNAQYNNYNLEIYEKENIKSVINLQNEAVKLFNDKNTGNYSGSSFTINYRLKNGQSISRTYPQVFTDKQNSLDGNKLYPALNKVLWCKEIIDKTKFQYELQDIVCADIGGLAVTNNSFMSELETALKLDMSDRAEENADIYYALNGYTDVTFYIKHPYAEISMKEKLNFIKTLTGLNDKVYTDYFKIYNTYTNSIRVLEKYGYFNYVDDIKSNADNFKLAYVVPIVSTDAKDGDVGVKVGNSYAESGNNSYFFVFDRLPYYEMSNEYGCVSISNKGKIKTLISAIDDSSLPYKQFEKSKDGYLVYFYDENNNKYSTIKFISKENMPNVQ